MAERSDNTPLSKLAQITDIPLPSDEEVARAKAEGALIVAYSPGRSQQFIAGQITLADFAGVPKEAQYRMAEVGHTHLQQGKLDSAEQVFLGLLALDPFDAYFHLALGSVHQQRSAWEAAEAAYTRSLEINPFSAAALTNRGEVRLHLGKVVEGTDDLGRVSEIDPEAREPATRRAQALVMALKDQLEKSGGAAG